ncbi:MAG: CDP-alcohol phosphatidyltransferase family protein, partial [Blautia obeum]
IWFHITPMVSDLLIGLCAIMMVISVALYIIQNTRTLKEETV